MQKGNEKHLKVASLLKVKWSPKSVEAVQELIFYNPLFLCISSLSPPTFCTDVYKRLVGVLINRLASVF